MKKNVRLFRFLAVLLIFCALVAGCTPNTDKEQTQEYIWQLLQAAVKEVNARRFYQVVLEIRYDYSDDKLDETVVYEYVQHDNNEYSSTTIGGGFSDFVLRYNGASYWRRSNNPWMDTGSYTHVTSLAVSLPDAQDMTWTETDGGLVVECRIPNEAQEQITYYLDGSGKLIKTVTRMNVSTDNGVDHVQTVTASIGDPTEAAVLLRLQETYEEARRDTALPTEPPEVLDAGEVLIRYVAAGSSAYRDEAYYVFRGGELIEISVETVKEYAPEAVYVWPDSHISDADEALTASQWQVSLLYVPETSQFGDGENWLPTRFGEHWRIYYNHEPYDMEPSDYFLSILPEIVYDFHNGDLDGFAGARTLAYFTIVNTNDGFLVEYLDNLYLWNGSSKLLMEGSRDSGCQYDYYTVITP